jgi:Restriction endonuclease NaeI
LRKNSAAFFDQPLTKLSIPLEPEDFSLNNSKKLKKPTSELNSKSFYAIGLVRCRADYLTTKPNRDGKTTISAAGRANIWWLVSDYSYTPNFWSLIDEDLRFKIMNSGAGAKRLAALFEFCLGMPVSRVQVEAVAAQDDFMKRLRKNGGARDILAPKKIAILYSETDRELMHKLGLNFGYREFMSHRPMNIEQEELLRGAGKID